MTEELLTPNEVVKQLTRLAQELDATTELLREADHDSTLKRHQADLAEAKAYLSAEGPVEERKRIAKVATERIEEEALVSEALVRYLKNKLKSLDLRIEVGRSLGTSLRAEMRLMPYSETP